jgi:hypothetical protein
MDNFQRLLWNNQPSKSTKVIFGSNLHILAREKKTKLSVMYVIGIILLNRYLCLAPTVAVFSSSSSTLSFFVLKYILQVWWDWWALSLLWSRKLPVYNRKGHKTLRSRCVGNTALSPVFQWRGQKPVEAWKLQICGLPEHFFSHLWQNEGQDVQTAAS